jgi:hypothetical protein
MARPQLGALPATPAAIAFGDTASVGTAGTNAALSDHRHAAPANPVTAHEAAADPHTGYQKESEKNAVNGYLGLNSEGKVLEPWRETHGYFTSTQFASVPSWTKIASGTIGGTYTSETIEFFLDTMSLNSALNTRKFGIVRMMIGTDSQYPSTEPPYKSLEILSGNLVPSDLMLVVTSLAGPITWELHYLLSTYWNWAIVKPIISYSSDPAVKPTWHEAQPRGIDTSAVSIANPSKITCGAQHFFTSGQTVTLSGFSTTPDINGNRVVTVVNATEFTIPVNVTAVADGTGQMNMVLPAGVQTPATYADPHNYAWRAGFNVSGGGTVTVSAGGYIKNSTRFIIISNGSGEDTAYSGYFDINIPTSGTITGVGGASNKTATSDGIPLDPWEALYYVLPLRNAFNTDPANFRVSKYTARQSIPDNWLLIAVRNGDSPSVFKIANGMTLGLGQSATWGGTDHVLAGHVASSDPHETLAPTAFTLPNTANTGEGRIAWEGTNDYLVIGDGAGYEYVFPAATTAASTQAFGDAAATGTAWSAARGDHKHAMPANPVTAHEASGADMHPQYQKESEKGANNGYAELSSVGYLEPWRIGGYPYNTPMNNTGTTLWHKIASGTISTINTPAAGAAHLLMLDANNTDKARGFLQWSIMVNGAFGVAPTATVEVFNHRDLNPADIVIVCTSNTPTMTYEVYLKQDDYWEIWGYKPVMVTSTTTINVTWHQNQAGVASLPAGTQFVCVSGTYDTTAPSTQAFGDTAVVGIVDSAARRDHKHAMPAAPTAASVGAGPSTADYLVGTANAGLSGEIVVGTSPGGELGGTWASPTVDATHSGSTHAATQAAAESTAASALSGHVAAADPHTGYLKESVVSGLAAPALTLGTANSAGAALTAFATNSTIAAFDATVPAALGTAATGSAAFAARRDHVHLDPVVAHAAAGDPHTVYVLESAVPGGELGGTYASPTVDATHSGSSHAGVVSTHEAAADPHTVYQKESEKNAASGYPGLDGYGKIIGRQTTGGYITTQWDGTTPAGPVWTKIASGSFNGNYQNHVVECAVERENVFENVTGFCRLRWRMATRDAYPAYNTNMVFEISDVTDIATTGSPISTSDFKIVVTSVAGPTTYEVYVRCVASWTIYAIKPILSWEPEHFGATGDVTWYEWQSLSATLPAGTQITPTIVTPLALGSTPSTQAFGDAAAGGSATTASKNDHKHAMPANPVRAQSSTTPAAIGTSGAVGSGTTDARADHVHAHETAHIAHDTIWDAKGDIVTGSAADTAVKTAIGANDTILMADSSAAGGVKWVAPAAPVSTESVDSVPTSGSADTWSRSDHKHGQGHVDLTLTAFSTDITTSGTLGTIKYYDLNGSTMNRFLTPGYGRVKAISVRCSNARTSGTIKFSVWNDTSSIESDLNCTLDVSDTQASANMEYSITANNNIFGAFESLMIRSEVTAATYAPITADVTIVVVLSIDI